MQVPGPEPAARLSPAGGDLAPRVGDALLPDRQNAAVAAGGCADTHMGAAKESRPTGATLRGGAGAGASS